MHTGFYLHLTRRPVALEILHVGGGVPQTPLGEGKQLQAPHLMGGILQRQLLHLGPCVERYEEENRGFDATLRPCDAGVVHAVAAFVCVERCLAGFPSGTPHRATIVDVEVAATGIHRHAIVAVARDTAELGVFVETVAASGVADETEEILIAQIVNPGKRCLRVGDDILAVFVVKITEFHSLYEL